MATQDIAIDELSLCLKRNLSSASDNAYKEVIKALGNRAKKSKSRPDCNQRLFAIYRGISTAVRGDIQHTVGIVSGVKGDIPAGGPIGGTSGPAKALETRQKLKNNNLHIFGNLSPGHQNVQVSGETYPAVTGRYLIKCCSLVC